MPKSVVLFSVLLVWALLTPSVAQAEEAGKARFDRATLIVRDMEASLAFWRDVMQFEMLFEPRKLPPLDNEYLGWRKEGVLRFVRLQSPDGAGIGLMEITQPDFPDLNIDQYPNAHGSVVFVHVATDIDALYKRAKDAGAVLKPLGLSRSGRSKQMYLKSPSGHLLEIYELLSAPAKAD